MKRNLAAVFGLLVLPGTLLAQNVEPPVHEDDVDNTRYGGTSAVFLTLPADARGAALGGSYAALVTDVSSMFWNPAGLALMESNQAMFSYTQYVADTRHLAAGLGWSLRGGELGFGLSISNFGFNNQPVYTEEQQEGTGEIYSVSETAIGATAALQFSDKFSAGLTARYIIDQLASTTAKGMTFDFGTNYHTDISGRPFRASFIVQNYGPQLTHRGPQLNTEVDPEEDSMNVENQPAELRTSGFDPPTQFRVGAAFDVLAATRNRLTLLSEFTQPTDTDPSVGFGAEFSTRLAEGFTAALRGSYSYQPDNSDTDESEDFRDGAFASSVQDDAALDGLAVGGGLAYRLVGVNLGLDYAWRHLGVLSGVNQFSVRLGW